ncbi:MAG: MFS transporter [bacterium]
MSEVPAATAPKKPLRTSLWVSSTYFAEGLPYVIVLNIATVFFTDMGVREALLGFLNFFGIPWNLKFIWAPLLDLFGTKRGWMLKIQMAITVILFVIACLAGIHGTAGSSIILKAIAFSFVALAFIAATNDISIDAYYLEGLTDKREQAAYTGLRITAYRIAVIYARTVLVAVAGIANWFWGFTAGAVTMLAVLILHAFLLPKFEAERTGPSKTIADVGRGFVDSFVAYLTQAKPLTIILILLFVATYKMGDGIIFSMYTPFFKRELGVTNLQYSWLSGFVAALATIAGSLLGACWIKKLGLKRAIWPITLFMNLNIWAYVLLSAPLRRGDLWNHAHRSDSRLRKHRRWAGQRRAHGLPHAALQREIQGSALCDRHGNYEPRFHAHRRVRRGHRRALRVHEPLYLRFLRRHTLDAPALLRAAA